MPIVWIVRLTYGMGFLGLLVSFILIVWQGWWTASAWLATFALVPLGFAIMGALLGSTFFDTHEEDLPQNAAALPASEPSVAAPVAVAE